MGQRFVITETDKKLISDLYGSDIISENKKIVDFIKDKIMDIILPVIKEPSKVVEILKALSRKGLITLSLIMTVLVACSEMGQERTFDEVVQYTLGEEWLGSEDEKVYMAIYMETSRSTETKMLYISSWAFNALKYGEKEAFSRLKSEREKAESMFNDYPEVQIEKVQETSDILQLISDLKEKYKNDTVLRDKLVWESLNDLKNLDSGEPLSRLVRK